MKDCPMNQTPAPWFVIVLPFPSKYIMFSSIPLRLGRPLDAQSLAHDRIQGSRGLLHWLPALRHLALLLHICGGLGIIAGQEFLKVGPRGKRLSHEPISADEHRGDAKIELFQTLAAVAVSREEN